MASKRTQMVRKLTADQSIHLTFDDGPDVFSTPVILDCLAEQKTKATFFVIAEKAEKNPALLRRMLNEGHAIGNHSLNHQYSQYFRGQKKIAEWVRASEDKIAQLTGKPTIGFRPPAGVYTPELRWALNDLQMPLILWNVRFFDTTFAWSFAKAEKSLKKMVPGSIVLLHDRKKESELSSFLETLKFYIQSGNQKGWNWASLELQQCKKAAGFF